MTDYLLSDQGFIDPSQPIADLVDENNEKRGVIAATYIGDEDRHHEWMEIECSVCGRVGRTHPDVVPDKPLDELLILCPDCMKKAGVKNV